MRTRELLTVAAVFAAWWLLAGVAGVIGMWLSVEPGVYFAEMLPRLYRLRAGGAVIFQAPCHLIVGLLAGYYLSSSTTRWLLLAVIFYLAGVGVLVSTRHILGNTGYYQSVGALNVIGNTGIVIVLAFTLVATGIWWGQRMRARQARRLASGASE